MADQAKAIMVVARSARLSAATKKMLEASGYVVVRGDPRDFRVLDPTTFASPDIIIASALGAISNFNSTGLRDQFAREILARVANKKGGTL